MRRMQIPSASYAHVNFDCLDVGTPIARAQQDELTASLHKSIDTTHEDLDCPRPQLHSILNAFTQVKDRFLLFKSLEFQHLLNANP
jgi:hypothetical protein